MRVHSVSSPVPTSTLTPAPRPPKDSGSVERASPPRTDIPAGLPLVRPPPQDRPIRLIPCRLLPMVLALLIGAFAGGRASATAVSSAAADTGITPGHHCRCKGCRGGGTCCCRPLGLQEPARPRPSAPRRPGPNPAVDTRICLSAAPCGDAGLPNPGTPVRSGLTALGIGRDAPRDDSGGRWLCQFPSLAFPAPIVSRLDDPPETAHLLFLTLL
jgi:hypothetical protein